MSNYKVADDFFEEAFSCISALFAVTVLSFASIFFNIIFSFHRYIHFLISALPAAFAVISFKLLLDLHSLISESKKGTAELTPEEQIKEHEKQISLTNTEIQRTEKEDELVQRQMELADKKQKLEMLLQGKLKDPDERAQADDFAERIKGIKSYGEIEKLAEEEKTQNPNLSEYIDATLDIYRRRLLEDK